MNTTDKKTQASKKEKVAQNDKYYKVNADFDYLKNYNYKVTKEIGRGGYGVVYKVTIWRRRRATSATRTPSAPSRSTLTRSPANSSTQRWPICKS